MSKQVKSTSKERKDSNYIISKDLNSEDVNDFIYYVIKNHSLIQIIDSSSFSSISKVEPIINHCKQNKINFVVYNVDDMDHFKDNRYNNCVIINTSKKLKEEFDEEEWNYFFDEKQEVRSLG